jgi:hypothetical protein
MALVVLGVQVGSALLPVAVVLLRDVGGWRLPWIASAIVLMLVGYPSVLRLLATERVPHSTEYPAHGARMTRDWTRAEVIRDPVFYLLLSGVLAPPFIGTTIFFHQGYLIALRGYDPLVFAAAFPVMAVTTVVFGLICGQLVDRLGALRLLPFFLIPLAVASAAVGLVTPVWGIPFHVPARHQQWFHPDAAGGAVAGGLRCRQPRRHPRDHRVGHGAVHGAGAWHQRRLHRSGRGAANADAVDGRLVRGRIVRPGGGIPRRCGAAMTYCTTPTSRLRASLRPWSSTTRS